MRILFFGGLFTGLSLKGEEARAQEAGLPDSSVLLGKVTVEGYLSGQPLLQTPASVNVLNAQGLRTLADERLLPALNTLPGLRMEERSPGSYRLSLRGSLLRSPWGVRNVKVYLEEFPLTDAGGNTYLNLIDPNAIGRVEVLKGPDGSLFGANSGGVLLLSGAGRQNAPVEAGMRAGSYGLFHQYAGARHRKGKTDLNIRQAFLRSDGYREHSALRRHYLDLSWRMNYGNTRQLHVAGFYADLGYDTPGGLTESQYLEDPRQARPASGSVPGAAGQGASVRTRTFFGGISHRADLAPKLHHVAALFASRTDFENPFITNYEFRDEFNYGFRTYLELEGPSGNSLRWQAHLGLEWQQSQQEIRNYDNLGGATPGDIQAADDLNSGQSFFFARFKALIGSRLHAEAALSLNKYRYEFEPLEGGEAGLPAGERDFSPEWMPRLSLSYLLQPELAWRISVSRGYSPPTTAEIRPSNMDINTDLAAERGYNYESGLRWHSGDQRFEADVSVFYYRLEDAIVRRLDEGGEEFFQNAGGTDQWGLESLLSGWLQRPGNNGAFRGIRLQSSYTLSRFFFRDYLQAGEDYSGNRLTGVPRSTLVSGLELYFPKALRLSAWHNFTSRIPLNDANTVFADGYHLLQARLSWQGKVGRRVSLEIFASADNLFNERYSLGNDINAFGGRYYNTAPLRNFSGGVRFIY